MATQENPTEQLLLPGQQFTIGVPWERGAIPPPPTSAPLPLKPGTNTLDHDADVKADPLSGLDIGQCQVIKRLSPDSVKSLLAMRTDRDGTSLVVMKKLQLAEGAISEVLARASWATRLTHPNLSRVVGCEVSDEGVFWVNEFVSGATLSEIAIACRREGKSIPLGFALAAVHEAAQGLAELHTVAADMHGLVSDHSVVVTFEGQARLLDVGLFRCIVGQPLWADEVAATQSYLAPEQVLHGRFPDPKTDVYALGVVLYECLTGQKMYRANSFDDRVKWHQHAQLVRPSALNVAVGRELDEVVMTALSADRSRRYASAAEFASALKQATVAYMWRSSQRALFVTDLFRTRKRREQVLLQGVGPRTSESLPKIVHPAPMVDEPPVVVGELEVESIPQLLPVAVAPAPVAAAIPEQMLSATAAQFASSPKVPWLKALTLVAAMAGFGLTMVVQPELPLEQWVEDAKAAVFPPLLNGPKASTLEMVVKRVHLIPEEFEHLEWTFGSPWLGPTGWEQSEPAKAEPRVVKKRKAEAPLPPWLRKGRR